MGAPLNYTEVDRLAFLARHEPDLDDDERAALRSTYWDDDRIDMAIALGG